MAKIETIDVKVKYSVGLGGLTVPKKVLEQLEDAANNCKTLDLDARNDKRYADATEWLINHIKERDCYEWECEVEDLILPE